MAEEEWRGALRQRLAAGQSIAGLPKPLWPEAPMDPGLLAPLVGRWDATLRSGGPLARSLGPRIAVDEFFDPDRHEESDRERLSRVKAWPVLPLDGATFEVDDVSAIAPALRVLLRGRLPGADWWVPEHWDGPFLKYGILHNCLPAPPNETTGEPMALEIYGWAERALAPGSDEWAQVRRQWMVHGSVESERPDGVQFPTRVSIEVVATYANITYPGVGIALYM